MSIQILDCTLRDGGYVNNWNFGESGISDIIKQFVESKIDFIECGFLENKSTSKDKTIFQSVQEASEYVPLDCKNSKMVLMIMYGSYDLSNLELCTNKAFDTIRVVFSKSEIDDALEYCQQVMDKGYKVFVNPAKIDTYSSLELLNLIIKVNKLGPRGFSIVDTLGVLKQYDIESLFYHIDKSLNPDIVLCFHSHNNLQLSFSNAQRLIDLNKKRSLVIDVCVFGMGRGAGNLPTELLVQYLIDNYNAQYDLIPILKVTDEYISKIFAKTPWGYSVPYYLAATNNCHPNYASFLVDKQTVSVEAINSILENIPSDKKTGFDKDLINKMYFDYQNHFIDDSKAIEKLKEELSGKHILLVGPGKSIQTHQGEISDYIEKYQPYIISLNFLPENYRVDKIFISNAKRYNQIHKSDVDMIVTSNIVTNNDNCAILNYSSYLNKSKMPDNVALMLLQILISLEVDLVAIAGLDGFSKISTENYVDDKMINTARMTEFDIRNDVMREALTNISKFINIKYITPSFYA